MCRLDSGESCAYLWTVDRDPMAMNVCYHLYTEIAFTRQYTKANCADSKIWCRISLNGRKKSVFFIKIRTHRTLVRKKILTSKHPTQFFYKQIYLNYLYKSIYNKLYYSKQDLNILLITKSFSVLTSPYFHFLTKDYYNSSFYFVFSSLVHPLIYPLSTLPFLI